MFTIHCHVLFLLRAGSNNDVGGEGVERKKNPRRRRSRSSHFQSVNKASNLYGRAHQVFLFFLPFVWTELICLPHETISEREREKPKLIHWDGWTRGAHSPDGLAIKRRTGSSINRSKLLRVESVRLVNSELSLYISFSLRLVFHFDSTYATLASRVVVVGRELENCFFFCFLRACCVRISFVSSASISLHRTWKTSSWSISLRPIIPLSRAPSSPSTGKKPCRWSSLGFL